MNETDDNLKAQAETMLENNLSGLSSEYAEKMWQDILAFIESNNYVTADDFLKVMALLRDDEAYQFQSPQDKIIDESTENIENSIDFDEVAQELLPDEVAIDHTAEHEAQNQQREEHEHEHESDKKQIDMKEVVKDEAENYLQDDLITLILHDINELVDEARAKSLDQSLGGLSSHDAQYIDHMIAQAPHQVVKGTLKALYQHVSGMYQNLIYGSEIYPDEAGFGGAIKDILADKTMIHGQEPWQVKFGPGMSGGGQK